MRLRYLGERHEHRVRTWWKQLQPDDGSHHVATPVLAGLGRGDRARLRRAASLEELETERAAQLLVAGLLDEPWRNSAAQCWCAGDERPALLTAGVLAAVKSDTRDGRSLAWHVGHAAGSGGTPPMSEVRFKRLLKATTLGEFFTAARRAVVLANGARGGTDVAVLADDLMAWAFEHSSGWRDRPAQTMCFRWAQDYYQPLKGKDADLAADDKLTEGDRA